MKTYKGMVIQRCYIPVTIEVEDDTLIQDVSYQMGCDADAHNGCWESEVVDIAEVIKGE